MATSSPAYHRERRIGCATQRRPLFAAARRPNKSSQKENRARCNDGIAVVAVEDVRRWCSSLIQEPPVRLIYISESDA